jgi:aerobic C4-dicarboxylate transport protein
MKVSPLAAFGAMAYTIGKFGLGSLSSLGQLMGSVYITMALFIIFILGSIAKIYGFNIFKFIAYLKEEILLVLGTSSSESALPSVMKKLEKYGCSKSVVGLVVPTGYSFNLDGTSIYLSMAAIFIAQAYGVDLSIWQELTLLGILMLTSKGAAGVTGSGFITLAATLAAFPMIPVEGMALLLGVDRFMSEARAITNLIGNSVATVVISKSEGEFNPNQAISGDMGEVAVSSEK